jgi:hypothetical protein
VEVSTSVPQTLAIAGGAFLVSVVDYRLLLVGQAVLMLLGGLGMLFAGNRRDPDLLHSEGIE